MVSSGFNFASYKSAFGNTPQMGTDKEVSQKSEDGLALNTMMDHGIENQAISNVVQGRDRKTAVIYCTNFRPRNEPYHMDGMVHTISSYHMGHIIYTISYGPYHKQLIKTMRWSIP